MVHNYPKIISPKMNVIASLESELTFYNVVVNYTTGAWDSSITKTKQGILQ